MVLVVSAHRADAQELAPAPVPLQPELLTTLPVVSLDATIFAVEPFAEVNGVADDPPQAAVQSPTQAPPLPRHSGFGALVRGVGSDYAMFPRRKSTYVILAIGGAAAALAYPIDDNVNEAVQDKDGLRNAFVLGKYIGSTHVLTGAAIGTYVIGRLFREDTGRSDQQDLAHRLRHAPRHHPEPGSHPGHQDGRPPRPADGRVLCVSVRTRIRHVCGCVNSRAAFRVSLGVADVRDRRLRGGVAAVRQSPLRQRRALRIGARASPQDGPWSGITAATISR